MVVTVEVKYVCLAAVAGTCQGKRCGEVVGYLRCVGGNWIPDPTGGGAPVVMPSCTLANKKTNGAVLDSPYNGDDTPDDVEDPTWATDDAPDDTPDDAEEPTQMDTEQACDAMDYAPDGTATQMDVEICEATGAYRTEAVLPSLSRRRTPMEDHVTTHAAEAAPTITDQHKVIRAARAKANAAMRDLYNAMEKLQNLEGMHPTDDQKKRGQLEQRRKADKKWRKRTDAKVTSVVMKSNDITALVVKWMGMINSTHEDMPHVLLCLTAHVRCCSLCSRPSGQAVKGY